MLQIAHLALAQGGSALQLGSSHVGILDRPSRNADTYWSTLTPREATRQWFTHIFRMAVELRYDPASGRMILVRIPIIDRR